MFSYHKVDSFILLSSQKDFRKRPGWFNPKIDSAFGPKNSITISKCTKFSWNGGVKTLLDIYYLIKDRYLQTPISIYMPRQDELNIHPGTKRFFLLHYLPRQPVGIIIKKEKNKFNFYNDKFLQPKNLLFREFSAARYKISKIANELGVKEKYEFHDDAWLKILYERALQDNITMYKTKDAVFINDVKLFKTDFIGNYVLNLPLTFKTQDVSNYYNIYY
jgi:hypothetical protein